MGDPNRSMAAPPERVTVFSWDLIADEPPRSRAIIMRFGSYEAAHAVLTGAGFAPTGGSVHVPPHHDAAVKYVHSDGTTVVLARQLVEWHGRAERCPERLGQAAVGG